MHLTLNLKLSSILLDNGQIILGSNQENAVIHQAFVQKE
jgi:hypothetical protein